MMKDIQNQKFGRLTAIKIHHSDKKAGLYWECKCDCGNTVIVLGAKLRSNRKLSCGCLTKKLISEKSKKHGMSDTSIYNIWEGMKRRCYNCNFKHYKNYGARGIKVCDAWKNDFMSFYNWAINNGYKEGLTIERIDVNGNYCPENCKWIPKSEQANNKRNTVYIEYNGEKHNVTEWAKIIGINSDVIFHRLKKKYPINEVLFKEVKKINKTALTYKDKTQTISQWSRETGISRDCIKSRIKLGWDIERILTEKPFIGKNQTYERK